MERPVRSCHGFAAPRCAVKRSKFDATGSAMNLTAPMAPHHVDHDEATTVSAIAATVALGEVKTVSASAQNARTAALGRPTASLQVPRSRIAKAHVHADRRGRW